MFLIFIDAVKRMSIFLIISQTIMHFGIGEKYEKYVKFVVSFMLVAQMIFSFGAYFQNKESHFGAFSKQGYYEKWEEYLCEVEKNYEKQQRELEQGMVDFYKMEYIDKEFREEDSKSTDVLESGLSTENKVSIESDRREKEREDSSLFVIGKIEIP